MMTSRSLYLLPLLTTVLTPFSLIVTYIIAVRRNHVEIVLPYISECAARPPESDFFAQTFNLSAVLVCATICVHYQIITALYEYNDASPYSQLILLLNRVSLPCGILLAFGVSMVANFRAVELLYVHDLGAFITFAFGIIYCFLQTIASYLMIPDRVVSLRLARFRLAITFTLCTSIITMIFFGIWSFAQFKGNDQFHWKPADGGYVQHVISSASEWLFVLSLNAAIGTSVHEFKVFSRLNTKDDRKLFIPV